MPRGRDFPRLPREREAVVRVALKSRGFRKFTVPFGASSVRPLHRADIETARELADELLHFEGEEDR